MFKILTIITSARQTEYARELTNEAANDRTKHGRRPVECMNLTYELTY